MTDTFKFDFDERNKGVESKYHANGGGIIALTATVSNSAYVGPDARVYENSIVDGTCKLNGNSRVFGNSVLANRVILEDNAIVRGDTFLSDITIHSDMVLSTTPITMQGFEHPIVISHEKIIIGCLCIDVNDLETRGKAALKLNGYPKKSAERIISVIKNVYDCYLNRYHDDDVKEVFDILKNSR